MSSLLLQLDQLVEERVKASSGVVFTALLEHIKRRDREEAENAAAQKLREEQQANLIKHRYLDDHPFLPRHEVDGYRSNAMTDPRKCAPEMQELSPWERERQMIVKANEYQVPFNFEIFGKPHYRVSDEEVLEYYWRVLIPQFVRAKILFNRNSNEDRFDSRSGRTRGTQYQELLLKKQLVKGVLQSRGLRTKKFKEPKAPRRPSGSHEPLGIGWGHSVPATEHSVMSIKDHVLLGKLLEQKKLEFEGKVVRVRVSSNKTPPVYVVS